MPDATAFDDIRIDPQVRKVSEITEVDRIELSDRAENSAVWIALNEDWRGSTSSE